MTLRIPTFVEIQPFDQWDLPCVASRYSLLWICEAAARLGQRELAEILGAFDDGFFCD